MEVQKFVSIAVIKDGVNERGATDGALKNPV